LIFSDLQGKAADLGKQVCATSDRDFTRRRLGSE
jgi:hypothetical protein